MEYFDSFYKYRITMTYYTISLQYLKYLMKNIVLDVQVD
jgi:hypothetical protein